MVRVRRGDGDVVADKRPTSGSEIRMGVRVPQATRPDLRHLTADLRWVEIGGWEPGCSLGCVPTDVVHGSS